MTQISPASGPGLFREALRLLGPFWRISAVATAAGIASGLATAGLLATINTGLRGSGTIDTGLLLRLAVLCVVSVGGSILGGIGNSVVGQKVIAALRKDVSARVLHAPIESIEQQRSHKLLAVLTNDVDTVSAFTFNVSGYAVALAIVLGSFGYLLFLSPVIFCFVLLFTVIGILVNIHARRGWIRDYEGVRDSQDALQKQYRALTEGAKELRLSRDRRGRVQDVLLSGAADRIAELKSNAMRLFWIADGTGAGLFFILIGLLLAAGHLLGLTLQAIGGAVLVLLYIKGPIEEIASGLPVLGQAQVAFRRIAALSAEFRSVQTARSAQEKPAPSFTTDIALAGARFGYAGAGGGFTLGPVDLRVRRNETLFIVGGNGSGKTTLIKLLLGLYAPNQGELLLDGVPVAADARDAYRQLFSAVFSDYFLFDDLVAADAETEKRANEYLALLELSGKVEIKDGMFTTTDLSAGQRKRLALVHAYLEGRPVMMFDEWAADQDPTFRRIFYTELLADLKQQGKTLIVVSHDDRYFDVADRVIRMENGRLIEQTAQTDVPC